MFRSSMIRPRASRWGWVPLLAAAALLIGVLPGGTASDAESATPLLEPYGGEAVVGDDQEPPTLKPFVPGGDNFIVTKIGQATWTGVQDIDGFTLALIPDVVTQPGARWRSPPKIPAGR